MLIFSHERTTTFYEKMTVDILICCFQYFACTDSCLPCVPAYYFCNVRSFHFYLNIAIYLKTTMMKMCFRRQHVYILLIRRLSMRSRYFPSVSPKFIELS